MEDIPDLLIGLFISLLYYVPQELIFGRTLGKLVTGTKVVGLEDNPPTAGEVLLRTLIRIISIEWISFVFDKTGMGGWHDKWSKTKVVQIR